MSTYDEIEDVFVCGTCDAEFRVEVLSADVTDYCPCCGNHLGFDDEEDEDEE